MAAMSTTVDLGLIQKLTNLSDINRILNETLAKERALDVELDQLLSKRADLERSFLLLNAPTAEALELIHEDCQQMLQSVQATSVLAAHISGKVRTLDTAQSRVQETLSDIKSILDRTNCINGVQAAMDSQDYETAANFICTFIELDAKMASHRELFEDGQEDAQRKVLMEAKAQLEVVVDKQLEEAVAQRNQAAVLRYAKLYKPLGKQAEGLQRFVDFLRLTVAGKARAGYSTMAELLEAGKKADFVATLSLLFKDLAMTLEEHEAFIREVFGVSGVLEAVSGLQLECDSHGSRLLARFAEAKRVDRVVSEIRGRKRLGGGSSGATLGGGNKEGGPDPRQVDVLIAELLRLCQLSEEYNQFMLGKMRDALGSAQGQLTAARETNFRSGPFNVAVRELLGQYMALEEFYMNETCSLAVRIDESSPGSLTSSLVDDVFFILRKCGLRAMASGSVQCCAALLAELNNVVSNLLKESLGGKVAAQGAAARLLAAAPSAADLAGRTDTVPSSAMEYAVALNNTDVSSDYVVKLKTELEAYLSSYMNSPGEREKVRSVLSDLSKAATDLRQSNTRALEQLAEAIMPRLRAVMDELATVSYQLSDIEYSSREAEEGWAHHLVASVQLLMTWLQPILTTNNYEGLLHLLLDKLVSRLEALLGRKQFSQLGGLQLERESRTMLSALQELSSRTVRDKLSRLSQMALLLGLESAEEVLDFWTPSSGSGATGGGDSLGGGMTWRLSASEVRAVLLQRSDFVRDSVMVLPL
ncbi:hypothetical protein CEUSTIGMA_g4823.t1 [Chlamydomonas eustigma]|uniref:Conserved oligomeric Golgi complex subunit 4 n=1 Tax=Chlamydomonas eustigma TaxID=1157962 RepID=A0A250X2T1_9CHLO|nr:hypothetical protein CEUSTIGMA_g4823.t1 [Chlamydomonas eustigma]|eukprot:GAX77377.1 hypothetical protein CEUSTIGMA_g4823.t1 [Chlamydomonas eustigma]